MLSDARTRSVVIQCVLVAAVIGAATLLVTTTFTNLQMRGIPIGFDFLTTPSRIVISEAILSYKSRDPYYWAIVVGVANTIFISALVIVFSSVLGLIVGVTRLSSNPLAAGTCRVWVEIARNSPPIVLLIFLYSLWWKILPPATEALNPVPGVFASMRGVMVPSVHISMATVGVTLILVAGLIFFAARVASSLHRFRPTLSWAAVAVLLLGLWFADASVSTDWPVFAGSNFQGGLELTPELSTILIGLPFIPPASSPRSCEAASSPSVPGNGMPVARSACPAPRSCG
ncbi:hypothetical protein [Bosea spartocytisi]|uniref:hypothetical protein n=1 Tax=Bosea spartocytisi TaxID=2773451 RepID=UPI0021AAE1E5|nr:hypothetical protein [Bosea spartocytisi]MCT4475356.1 hypothetical protein [Bosea spartocytisi]